MKLISIALVTASVVAGANTNLADLPDPLVGTDSKFELSHGNTYPGVFLPFAMTNWTPQTGEGGWVYQYSKEKITGFRQTHRPSAWTTDWGAFALMPGTGALRTKADDRGAHFTHSDEKALPYCYRVALKEDGVQAAVAPTEHGGMLQFEFANGKDPWVVIDGEKGGSTVRIDSNTNTVEGTNSNGPKGMPPKFALYYVAVFNQPFAAAGVWDDKGQQDGVSQLSGGHVGAYLKFKPAAGGALTVRIGTSLISFDQARRNLQQEIPRDDFNAVEASARNRWQDELGNVEIEGGSAEAQRTFYTALYHTLQFPHLLNETDASGKTVHYSPFDGQVHPGPMFADDGFWDTFRAAFPLLTILSPQRDAEMIQGMVNAYSEGGWIPTWSNPTETNVMIGTHQDSIIADAYSKNIRDYDVDKAYLAIRKDATEPGTGVFAGRIGIQDYLRLGYIPYDKEKQSVARTLEYAYDDFCVAQLARGLGKTDDYNTFLKHAQNYRNLYNPSTGFMQGRGADGHWMTPFDPLDWGGPYTEGNAWQWLWSVQQDPMGLVALLGGKEAFSKRLDGLFTMTSDYKVGGYGEVIHEMTEAKATSFGQYAHINEPVHHVLYLYDYVGQPWKTQHWVHEVEQRLYRPGPSGWWGDEDTGETSAWYILSSLGFYQVTPGVPVYALGSPQFDRASIHLENGKTFTVEAQRDHPGDIYVQSVSLNDRPLNAPSITHKDITDGGTLHFRLGAEPNKQWGTGGMDK